MIRYDAETGESIGQIDYIGMPNTTDMPLPSAALTENQYYSFRDENGEVPYHIEGVCSWVVKDKLVKVTAYNKQTKQQKEFDDKTLVDGDYTLVKPATQFDEWINNVWVTNEQRQYEAELKQVDATRRALYSNVDALRNEADMIRLTENDEVKATDYDEQAKALYLKIRDENPWPQEPI